MNPEQERALGCAIMFLCGSVLVAAVAAASCIAIVWG